MNKKPAYKINGIGYPSSDKITSRISTLRRSMACTLMNRDACTPEQEQVWLKYFPDNKCVYCGQEATHLDHLHPLIRDNEPTGYGTDPGNLVPCCKDCNNPKSNMAWADFMRSSKCKHTAKPNKTLQESIDERVQNISDFQREMPAKFTDIDPAMKQQWKALWNDLEQLLKKTEDILLDMKYQLYATSASGNQTGTSVPKSSSSVTANTTATSSSRRRYSDDEKYAEAAYYLRKDASLSEVERICLGITNGNGSTAQRHLNTLGIETSDNSPHKGLLLTVDIDAAIAKETGVFKTTLEEIKARGLHLIP